MPSWWVLYHNDSLFRCFTKYAEEVAADYFFNLFLVEALSKQTTDDGVADGHVFGRELHIVGCDLRVGAYTHMVDAYNVHHRTDIGSVFLG